MDRESEVKDGHQIPGHFHRGLDCYVMNDKIHALQCSVGIAFQEVSFSYPSRPEEPVLKVSSLMNTTVLNVA